MLKKEALWLPSNERISSSSMEKFRLKVNKKYDINLKDYQDLYKWSVNYPANFWQMIFDDEIIYSKKYDSVINNIDKIDNPKDIRNYEWFRGAELNFAENLLRYKDDEVALLYLSENGEPKKITYNELYKLVAKTANSLKDYGVEKGDRVAAFITNNFEAVIGMLATSSIGAVWSSTSPDFGYQGVMDRFSQIQPKVIIAIDAYSYNGKKFNCLKTVEKIANQISSIEKVVVVNQFNSDIPKQDKYISWSDFINNDAVEIEFEQLPFDHPLYIMYSSGTTGVPKCIVHGAGGTLIQHIKELALHTNLGREPILYFTTTGWMMWNWLVSSLQRGATVVLFDGSPAYPSLSELWKLIDEHKIAIFGTSPKFLTTCQKNNIIPKNEFDLSSLKTILSTGAPLTDENFRWVYENVKNDLQLSSISGGTDIISCFMLGNPTLPVYSEEIQCRGLGMKVEAYSEEGEPLIEDKGELVCTIPFPSMPIYFWNDENHEKYTAAYFDEYPGLWRHGDYIKITENGGVVVYGRSDATLNPGGVRIGTAELYRTVEALDEVIDSIVVGLERNNDVEIVLFVKLRENIELNESLISKIKKTIKSELTPRHIPKHIFSVNGIPTTLNGKKTEITVKNIISGNEIKNLSAIANPEVLEEYKNIRI